MKQVFGRTGDRHRARLVGILAVAWLCMGAATLPDRGSPQDQEACTPDVFRLCSAMIPDEPAILVCLQSKADQLSPDCGKVIAPPDRKHRRKRERVELIMKSPYLRQIDEPESIGPG